MERIPQRRAPPPAKVGSQQSVMGSNPMASSQPASAVMNNGENKPKPALPPRKPMGASQPQPVNVQPNIIPQPVNIQPNVQTNVIPQPTPITPSFTPINPQPVTIQPNILPNVIPQPNPITPTIQPINHPPQTGFQPVPQPIPQPVPQPYNPNINPNPFTQPVPRPQQPILINASQIHSTINGVPTPQNVSINGIPVPANVPIQPNPQSVKSTIPPPVGPTTPTRIPQPHPSIYSSGSGNQTRHTISGSQSRKTPQPANLKRTQGRKNSDLSDSIIANRASTFYCPSKQSTFKPIEQDEIKGIPIGIDLGTTFSSLAFYNSSRRMSEVLTLKNGLFSMPSVVKLEHRQHDDQNTGVSRVGSMDFIQTSIHSLYDAKRLIGKSYEDYQMMGAETNSWTFHVGEKKDLVSMVIPSPFDTKKCEEFYPEEISALVLRELLSYFKDKFKETKIGKVVVTIPVDFETKQREATLRACKLAGLNDVELINEPSACVIEYRNNYKDMLRVGDKLLVIDFGGGTFDVCYCVVTAKGIESKAISGDQNLGGNDFDRAMVDLIKEHLNEVKYMKCVEEYLYSIGPESPETRSKTTKLAKLRKIAELMKRQLSETKCHDVEIPILELIPNYDDEGIYISRKDFEKKCSSLGLIERFKKVLTDMIVKNKFNPRELDLIIPIGGSCLIPIIQRTIDEMFPGVAKGDPRFDKLTAVAKGAAQRAFQIQGKSDEESNSTFVDVVPYRIGISVGSNHEMRELCQKDQQLPVKVEKIFQPVYDNSTFALFEIFSGDGMKCRDASNNICEGMKLEQFMRIDFDAPAKREEYKMVTTFTINRSGLLRVHAKKKKGGKDLGSMSVVLGLSEIDKELFTVMLNHLAVYTE